MKTGMFTDSDGTHVWYLNDKLLRREWWLNGKLHRGDGPAIEYADGHREWYRNGKLHRDDGPAVEYVNGTHGWYLNDKEYTFTEWLEHNQTLDNKTRLVYMLRYSNRVAA